MEEKKKLNFEIAPQQLKIKNLLNKEFIQVEIWAISDEYPNRNTSTFTLQSLEDGKKTIINKPVLGAFGLNGKPDFDGHNGDLSYDKETNMTFWDYENGERILGVIRESDPIEIEEKDNLHWLKFSCCLWTYYNFKAIKNILKNKTKKVSVEIEVLESYIDKDGIEVITKFIFLGVTILGNDISEGIPNAHMNILEKMEQSLFSKQIACLNFAYNKKEKTEEIEAQSKTGRSIAEIFGTTQSSDKNAGKAFSSLEYIDYFKQKEETIIDKKGGIVRMQLTYENKRGLLEKYLRDNLKLEDEKDNYIWVADISDDTVYFYVEGVSYSAPYTITEVEENTEVNIDLEQKVQVIRSWEVFSDEPKTQEVEKFVQIDGEEVDITALFEKFTTLNAEFATKETELTDKTTAFNELTTKFDVLQNTFKDSERDGLIGFATKMIDEEDDLDDENESDKADKETMKALVTEKCKADEFASCEEVGKFVKEQLAMALYEKRAKEKVLAKEKEEKEFNARIPNTKNQNNSVKTDAEILKEASRKLENI